MGYTLKKPLKIEGIGIHSGKKASVTFLPDKRDIIFTDVDQKVKVLLRANNISPIFLGTNIVKNDFCVKTIEHLCAALWFLKISGLKIIVNGSEMPILDGSSQVFIEFFKKIGLVKILKEDRVLEIKKSVYVQDGDSFVIGLPAKKFQVIYSVQYPSILGTQTFQFDDYRDFHHNISFARTFGNMKDLEYMHSQGLALGGSLDNALVFDGYDKYLNEPRFTDEAVRHKILDLIGDLYTSSCFIKGKIIAYKSSHKLNNKFIRKLIKQFKI